MTEPLLAFPEAVGCGRHTQGGRGGKVYHVTTLEDAVPAPPGSLREVMEAEGPRIAVFDVAGTIEAVDLINIKHPYLTVAGQTAPGDGVTVKLGPAATRGVILVSTCEVIFCGFRVRAGVGGTAPGQYGDSVDCIRLQNLDAVHHVILDHMSLSWGVDGVLDIATGAHHVTIQDCAIAEALHLSTHSYSLDPASSAYKQGHSRPFLIYENPGQAGTTGYISVVRTIVSNFHNRCPDIISCSGRPVDLINCLIDNWGPGSFVDNSRDWVVLVSTRVGNPVVNVMGCMFQPGPNSIYTSDGFPRHRLYANREADALGDTVYAYLQDNWDTELGEIVHMEAASGVQVVYAPAQQGGSPESEEGQADEPPAYKLLPRSQLLNTLLSHGGAGASYRLDDNGNRVYRRDACDGRILWNLAERRGVLVNDPSEVGGWPPLEAGQPLDWNENDVPKAFAEQHPGADIEAFLWG